MRDVNAIAAAVLITKRLLCIVISFRESFCLVYNSSTPVGEEDQKIGYAD